MTDMPQKRTRPWLIAVLLLAILLVSSVLMRHSITEWVAETVLKEWGFEEASLTVSEVGFYEIRITDLTLGDDLFIQDLSAGYQPTALLAGKVDWISINELKADLSHPDQGALGHIQALIKKEQLSEGEAKKNTVIPSVNITNAVLQAELEGRVFNFSISATVSPDLLIDGKVFGEASVQTASGPIRLEKVALSFSGNAAELKGKAQLESGFLKHDAEEPDWSPFSVTGLLEANGKKIDFHLRSALAEASALFRLEGQHVFANAEGHARFDIQDIVFDKAGLQPKDLSDYGKIIPPLDGILSSQSVIAWTSQKATVKSDILMKDFSLIGEGYSATAKDLALEVNGDISLETGGTDFTLVSYNQKARLKEGAREFSIEGVDLRLRARNGSQDLTLEQFRATAEHLSEKPYFVPVILDMTGETRNGQLSFSGQIQDRAGHLKAPFSGQFDPEKTKLFVNASLSHKAFTANGLQPADFSVHLADIPGRVSGRFFADLSATWSVEAGVQLSEILTRLEKIGYRDTEVKVSDLNINVKSKNISINNSFKIYFSDFNARILVNGETVNLENLAASFEVEEAWEAAILTLENLQLSSVGKGGLSHPVFLSGKSDIKLEEINFALTAKSDFFGTLMTGRGVHDLKKSAGKVNFKIPSLEFEQDGLQPTDLVRLPMQDLKLAGRVAVDIDMKWSQSGSTSEAVVILEDLDIQAGEGSMTGLSGTVHIDELDPLTISAVQELSAEEITSAVSLSQPLLRFRIGSNKGEPVLYVDDLKLGFVGGTASIKGAVIDTSASINSVRVELSNLDLEKLMALGEVEGFTASGTLDGYLPLRFDGEDLTIDTGVLETAGPGILQLKSERARQALARGGSQTKLLFDILENFQYSELGVQIRKKISGEDTISLHTKGSNPDIENNRPVVLNINLETNLGKILNTVLDGYLLSEKALRATVRNRSK